MRYKTQDVSDILLTQRESRYRWFKKRILTCTSWSYDIIYKSRKRVWIKKLPFSWFIGWFLTFFSQRWIAVGIRIENWKKILSNTEWMSIYTTLPKHSCLADDKINFSCQSLEFIGLTVFNSHRTKRQLDGQSNFELVFWLIIINEKFYTKFYSLMTKIL